MQQGGGVYAGSSATLTLIQSILYGNTLGTYGRGSGKGHAIFIASSSTTVTIDRTRLIGDAAAAAGTLLVSSGSANIDWGVCSPGQSPGMVAASIPMLDGGQAWDTTGCPDLCVKGSYGPGGNSTFLKDTYYEGCLPGCPDCAAGAVCPLDAMGAPQWCTPGRQPS